VTRNGEDPLLSEQENCQDMIEEPTKEEVDAAITGKWGHLFAVVRFNHAMRDIFINLIS